MSDDKTPEIVRVDPSVKLKVEINQAIKLASDSITFSFSINGRNEVDAHKLQAWLCVRNDEVDDEYYREFVFNDDIPLSLLFRNRLFDLNSFLQAEDPGFEADEWYDYLVNALNQVLMAGTLTFELGDDGSGSLTDNPHNMVIAIYQLGDFEVSLNLGRLTDDNIKPIFLDAEVVRPEEQV